MIVGASIPACPSVPLRPPPSPARRGRYNPRATSTTLKVGPAPPYVPSKRTTWHSPGRAEHGIVPAPFHRLRLRLRRRGPGAWRCSVREAAWHRSHRFPRGAGPTLGTAPIASRVTHETGRRRAIGAVAVPQPATVRPRRWCDAGPPAAMAAADQKAGVPGRHATRPVPRLPARSTASRTRDAGRSETEGGASPTLRQTRRPPEQSGPGRRRPGLTPPPTMK